MKKTRWTEDLAKEVALRCSSRSEFGRKYPGAYAFVRRNDILDQVCSHMKVLRNNWNTKSVKQAALKCRTKKEFDKKYRSALTFAIKNNILKEVCSHMVPSKIKWTKEKVLDESLKYSSLSQFHKSCRGGYDHAKRKGFLKEVEDVIGRETTRWTKEKVQEIALQYTTRHEFKEDYNGAHTYARRNGILDEVCSHMPIIGSTHKRCVYAIFDDTDIYVGLTCNFERRNHQREHLTDLKEKGRYVKLTDYLDVEIAMGVEKELIHHYKYESDLNCLNRHEGGGLGGSTNYYKNT